MRILHTSDWHIGRTFHGNSTLDALRGVLSALVAQVRENDVDVVVIAGDLFDSSTPSAAAYTLLSDTLGALADTGAVVIATSGNHDSPARLGFQSALLRPGIHVLTQPETLSTPVTVSDEHGDVDVFGVPYLEPSVVRSLWPDAEIRTQHQALAHALTLITDSRRDGVRTVVAAHTFAAGVDATAGLEREVRVGAATLSQGAVDVVPLSVFDGIDYVALGHIHGRQQLGPAIAYSGAPLHYSFGERDKPRGSWLVDMAADGAVTMRWLDLPIPRRLVLLRGELEAIITDAEHRDAENAWVAVEYTDATPQRDAMRRLQARFPHCASVVHTPAAAPAVAERSYRERLRDVTTDEDRVATFLDHVRAGEGIDDAERHIIDDVLAEYRRAEATA